MFHAESKYGNKIWILNFFEKSCKFSDLSSALDAFMERVMSTELGEKEEEIKKKKEKKKENAAFLYFFFRTFL